METSRRKDQMWDSIVERMLICGWMEDLNGRIVHPTVGPVDGFETWVQAICACVEIGSEG